MAWSELPGWGASESRALRHQILYWTNRLSYHHVVCLLEQSTGERLWSEDTLWRLVQSAAQDLDANQSRQIQDSKLNGEAKGGARGQSNGRSKPPRLPRYRCPRESHLYTRDAWEFLVLTDAIGVKAQKPTRERAGESRLPKKEKRHDTDVLLLPRPGGGEAILCEGVSGTWSLIEAAQTFLAQEWAGQTLPVVAISDGAQKIRLDLEALFGTKVRIILDWYHLKKRVYEQLSMMAHSPSEREQWEEQFLPLLWRGQVSAVLAVVRQLCVRSVKAQEALIGYLEKHAKEIIDYERRQASGKPVGSGRMEKGVDQVIGYRQKGKGMSWTRNGSRSLALLKTAELNGTLFPTASVALLTQPTL